MKALELLKKANRKKYKSIPFWSWNDELDAEELREQIRWMSQNGFGGYFMHARGGLTTEYLGDKWFECIQTCVDEGEKTGMESWAYDENGWPSGFVGGKLLEDENNRDGYLSFTTGEYDERALVSYRLTEDELVRVTEGGAGEYLNVYEHIAVSTVDICNGAVVDAFIAETHEQYKQKLGASFQKSLQGFFTDEPQYYRARQAYSKTLPDHFQRTYGEDIFDGLGLLFVKKKGYRAFRYKYWLSLQTLMCNNYAKKIYEWCDENGVRLTGHYIEERSLTGQMECCAGVMPFYEYEHIPGMDWLGRQIESSTIAPRQVSSVARQLGKKQVLTETFACVGWDVTPAELKRIAEWQYVGGVNLMCQHLMPYSEHGQRKRDYPTHFYRGNPWVNKDFKSFNEYFTRLGYLLGESEELVNTAYFCPIRSAYLEYEREDERGIRELDESYLATAERLDKMHIPYHVLDETIMEKHARVEGNKLVVGNCTYDYIVFPKTWTTGEFCKKLFEEFYKNGGKILFADERPTYCEGVEQDYALQTNVTWEEITQAQPYTVNDYDTRICARVGTYEGKPFLYAVNLSADQPQTITFQGKFKSFLAVDLESMTEKKVAATLTFAPTQSYVLFFSDEEVAPQPPQKTFTLSESFRVKGTSGNYMTLDKLRYSLDGKTYSDRMGYMGVFQELLKIRYEGVAYLKYEFTVKSIPNRIFLLAEDMHNLECTLNGREVRFDGVSELDKQIYKGDIAPFVREGVNEVILKIHFYEKENVYYVLFGEGVTESLKNCLAYDTTIEACYLQGDFGVYAEEGFCKGEEKNVYRAKEFYIDEAKTEVRNLLEDGYPFFSGEMTLEQTFESKKEEKALCLRGRYSLCDVKLNGKEVKKSYFCYDTPVGEYLRDGENVAEITLCVSNRNLLGPHHLLAAEEPLSVSPKKFELFGSWENGKSRLEREDYSFVRFGLFNE